MIGLINSIRKSMDNVEEKMCTKQDMEKFSTEIKAQVSQNAEDIKKLFSLRQEDKDSLQHRVQQVVEGVIGGELRDGLGLSASDRESYLKCRRSVRIWPVPPSETTTQAECRWFMRETLAIPREVIEGLLFEHVERVEQSRRSKIQHEVLIRFPTSQQRDIVQSYAVNLAKSDGKAGLRMEIPQYLEGVFKMMMEHSAFLSRNTPGGVKRSVKFDDIEMNLLIDIKLPQSEKWHRFSHHEIRDAVKNRQAIAKKKMPVSSDSEERKSILFTPASPGASSTWTTANETPVVPAEDESEEEEGS